MNIYLKKLTDIEQNIRYLENQKLEAEKDLKKYELDKFNELEKKHKLIKLMIRKDLHIVSGELIKPKLVTKEGEFVQYITYQELKELTKDDNMTETRKKIFLEEKHRSFRQKFVKDIDVYKRLKDK
tara:strand:- start:266 stop:643 length:378 start_codon:yes stop_codon:yes gene_type:complete